jgi:hypothetical protein
MPDAELARIALDSLIGQPWPKDPQDGWLIFVYDNGDGEVRRRRFTAEDRRAERYPEISDRHRLAVCLLPDGSEWARQMSNIQ